MYYNAVICRYHELATKGNNRGMFERCLVDNIRHLLRNLPPLKVARVRGRVWVSPPDDGEFTPEVLKKVLEALKKALGLENFSPAVKLPVDQELIRQTAVELVRPRFDDLCQAHPGRKPSFRVRARRSNKRYPLTSQQIEIDLVTRIAETAGIPDFDIDLDDAELTLGCEVRDEFSLLYFDFVKAPGGLPVGSNPRVLTLLSGGIDSPVAAYLTMKRGSPTDFITFHSSPYTPPETTEKVLGIAKVLNEYQRYGKVHLINLAEFQKLVRDCCKEHYRTILYRRGMFRIAEMVAKKTNCKALVTGEALGQVASQTVVNLDTINRSTEMLVLRPLIGADKLDAINLAREIGTLALSEVQVPDSCTVFSPSNPATAAQLDLVAKEELKIPDYGEVLRKIVDEMETVEV